MLLLVDFPICVLRKGCEYISGFFSFVFFVFRVSWQVQYFVDLAKHIFVAGAGLCGPWSAEFVAGAGLFVGLEVQISWQV